MSMKNRESGQLLIIVALGIVAFIGFAGIAVDLGNAYSQRRSAQNAADAGAMAAVRMMRTVDPNTGGSVIYNEIVRVATLNGNSQVDSTNTVFLDINGNTISAVNSYGGSLDSVAGVKVKTQIQFNTLFTGVLGINSMTAAGNAASMSMAVSSVSGGIMPLAMYDQSFTVGQEYALFDNGSAEPGNFGWLDFDGSKDTGDWIANGFDGTYEYWNDPDGASQHSTTLPIPDWMAGTTGVRVGDVATPIANLVSAGTTVYVPLYNSTTGSGENAKYQIVGLAAFVLTYSDMNANPKEIKATYVRSTMSADASTTYTTSSISTVRLVPVLPVPTSAPSATSAPAPTATSGGGWPTNTPTPTSTGQPTSTPTATPTSTPTPTATPAPPNAPTGLSMGAITHSGNDYSIPLTWQDNSNNETGFYVERSPDGTNGWVRVQTLGANVTSWTDTPLPHNNTYYYRAQAYNGTGASTYSNTVSGTTS